MGINVGTLEIQLRAQIAQLQQDLGKANYEIQKTAGQLQRDMRQASSDARQQMMLLENAIGVRLPRAMNTVLVKIPEIATAVNSAFAIGGIVVMASILIERLLPAIEKVIKYFSDAKDAAKDTVAQTETLAQAVDHVLKAQGEAQRSLAAQFQLVGLTGSAKMGMELQQLGAELDRVNETQRRFRDQVWGLEHGDPDAETAQGNIGVYKERLVALDAVEQTLLAKQAVMNAELKEAFTKEQTDQLNKHNEALTKYVDLMFKVYQDTQKIQASRSDLNGTILTGFEGVPAPGTGQTAPLYGGTAQAMELYKLQTDQNARLQEARNLYTGAQTAAEKYAFELQKINIIYGDKNSEDYKNALAEINKKYNENIIAVQKFGEETGHALEEGMLMGRKWSDVLKSLAVDLMQLILKMTVLKDLAASSGSGGFGGFLSSFVSGLASGGGHALGGPVTAGTSYMVGEQGPELFTPDSSGYITPNYDVAGMSIYIDARGADAGVEYRIRRALASLEERAVKRSLAAVRESNART